MTPGEAPARGSGEKPSSSGPLEPPAYSGVEARRLATRVLKAVLYERQPLDGAFAGASASEPFVAMPFRDRAFARAIATLSLRRLGQIEDMVRRFLDRPLPHEATDARLILVTGAAQLAFMDVAPHAAISLAVEQAKVSRHATKFAGLINAVLRRIAEQGQAIRQEQDALLLNTPDWLFKRWVRQYGEERTRLLVAAHEDEPALDLTVKQDAALWASKLGGTLLPWNSVRLPIKGRVEDVEGYDEGAWWVQDAAAAIPALLLGDVAGLRVADLCAAPGGKTAQLASRGALVTAVDVSQSRLRRLRENLKRLQLEASIVNADIAEWTPEAQFDAVLLDAPCSATGTIRRNPDIAYLKTAADMVALIAVQRRMLYGALRFVKPGGILVYCTCSLEAEEGEEQIERLLQSRDDVALDPIVPERLGLMPELVSTKGMLRTHPFDLRLGAGIDGMDGFFAARLRKVG